MGGAEWLARPANVRGAIGHDRIFVAFIDSELVAIAISWRLMTPTVGVNSLGLILTYSHLYTSIGVFANNKIIITIIICHQPLVHRKTREHFPHLTYKEPAQLVNITQH